MKRMNDIAGRWLRSGVFVMFAHFVGHCAAQADDKPMPRGDNNGHPLPKGALARLGSPQWRNIADTNAFVTFAPDGRTVVLGDLDVLRAIDFDTGRERWKVGQLGYDMQCAVASDGKIMVGGKKLVRFFAADGGREVAGIRTDAAASRVRLAANERFVALLDLESKSRGQLAVFDCRSGERVWSHGGTQHNNDFCTPIGFILGSDRLVVHVRRQRDEFVAIADAKAKVFVREWPLPKPPQLGATNGVELSPDGKLLGARGGDNKVRLWNVATGKEVAAWDGHADAVTVVAFFADGRRLMTAGKDRTLRIWDIAAGKPLGKIELVRTAYKIAVSPDGERAVALCAGENTLRRFDLKTLRELPIDDGHVNRIEQMAYTPDGTRLLTASRDGTVRVWDVAARRTVRHWKPTCRGLASLAVSGDGKLAATASYNDTLIEIWNIADGTLARSMTNPDGSVKCLAFAPTGTHLATGTYQLTSGDAIRVWDAASGAGVRELLGEPWGVGMMSFHPDGDRIAAAASDMAAMAGDWTWPASKVWNMATGRPATLNGALSPLVRFSPDGRSLCVAPKFQLQLIETASGKPRLSFDHGPRVKPDARFALHGRLVVAPAEREADRISPHPDDVFVWDAATGKQAARLELGEYVWCTAVSADSRTLATAGLDGTVLLWDLSAIRPADVAVELTDALWADLASDAVTAYRAVVQLGRAGERGAAFLREKLKPAKPADTRKLDTLFADLGNPRFAVRQKAAADWATLDCGEAVLRERLKSATNAEARRAIGKMLEGYDGWLTIPHELRRVRAVEAMERNGTPAARKLLQEWAAGDAASLLTREARSALQRKQQ